jgi:hypothetical protein
MRNLPKIYISPINEFILKAINNFDPSGEKVGYIVSQRQHTNHGGYVSKEIMDSIFSQRYILERDHFCLKEFDKSMIKYDANKFDIIHIDPWYFNQYNIQETSNWIKHFISNYPDIAFEFGTEDFIKELSLEEYKEALDYLSQYLDNFIYLVCQGGSVVFDLKNISPINIEKTKSFIELAKSYKLKIKRHNCDFHTDEELKLLSSLGVEAYNYAPEFTYISNKVIYQKLSKEEINIVNQEIINQAPWYRWVENIENIEKNILACLHYVEYLPEIQKYIKKSEDEIIKSISKRLEEICQIVY